VGENDLHRATLAFDYGGHEVTHGEAEAITVRNHGAGVVRIHRDLAAEAAAVGRLEGAGFQPLAAHQAVRGWYMPPGPLGILDSAGSWHVFLTETVPILEAEGWRVTREASFALRFEEAKAWHAEVAEGEADRGGWFDLRFDLEVEGRRLPLLPLIAPLIAQYRPDELPATVVVRLHRDTYLTLPAERLRPVLATLYQLYDRPPAGAATVRLSRLDAGRLGELEAQGVAVHGGEPLQELGRRLHDFRAIAPVAPPAGLRGELRPYQAAGLAWLQFLRDYQLGGLLADDMGLGKTVQTLAHLLVEKEAGRLESPALIVAPTSLMGNWQREAASFAPGLRVVLLHGADRRERFDQIDEADVVLTTYALLARDRETLLDHRYHYLILDEAQAVKNPRTRTARMVRQLAARHRLCLTGTPMENHLGELWAQLDFLMPGLLGDATTFKRCWRTPIERHGDGNRREALARRVAPFLLRRTKEEVATELPPKSEIVRTTTLGEAQATLYETIRVSMEKRVRDAIADKGLARSQITILDALLKLRQTCCDPRLLSLKGAKRVKGSAKLELLMEMVPEMVEEGRRILLFSQFTRMLTLIEGELGRHDIAYAKLTGQTRKRDEAIERFRSGEVPLFLISLKAGGVGLNLTEADTVILYDPWWNPAVENQAADRAHRIGQDKPVFVYRLLTTGTVEERILALQEKKRALAEGIYRRGGKRATALTQEDLQALFAPLEGE